MADFNNNKGGESKGETCNAQIVSLQISEIMIRCTGHNPKEVDPLIEWNKDIIMEIKTKRNIQ